MTARANQPFRWAGESYTCAHRAVLSLAYEIKRLILEAMQRSTGLRIAALGDSSNLADWQALCVSTAQEDGFLNELKEAGDRWDAIRAAYQEKACTERSRWNATSADELATALLLEANGAAELLVGNAGDELQTGFLSPRDLLKLYGLSDDDGTLDRLKKRLALARKHDMACFTEVANRAANEPQFLYRIERVRPILDDLKSSRSRPARK